MKVCEGCVLEHDLRVDEPRVTRVEPCEVCGQLRGDWARRAVHECSQLTTGCDLRVQLGLLRPNHMRDECCRLPEGGDGH